MRNKYRRVVALLLTIALCLSVTVSALAAEENVITIASVEELLDLSDRCALDAWSRGKTVVLTADLSLASVDFLPIPTFAGTFDGGGHTISGLDLSGRVSPAGLFGVLQEGAVVRDLNLQGAVTPSGDSGCTGGLAGENRGLISRCSFSGTVQGGIRVGGICGLIGPNGKVEYCTVSGGVTGGSMTGGLAGENRGVISGCENNSYINVTNVDPSVDLSALELSADLLTLRSLDVANIATDTGGVAGYSSGMLLSCTNNGIVGCQHIGYNIGGIAGRSCGFVSGCVNFGQVFGRKDVGGVVGQAEPDIVMDLSQDTIAVLRGQLDDLERMVDQTADDAKGISDDLSNRFDGVNEALDAVSGHAEELADRMDRYGESVVSEIDRGSDILADGLDRLDGVSDSADGLSEQITSSLGTLEQSVQELSDAGDYTGDLAKNLDLAAESLKSAGNSLDSGTASLRRGLHALRNAVQALDKDAVRDALNEISGSMDTLLNVSGNLNNAVEHLQDGIAEGENASDQAQAALDTLADATNELRTASRQSELVFDEAGELIDFLSQADPIQFNRPYEILGTAPDDLFDALNMLGDRLDALNGAASSGTRLADDVQTMNRKFGEMMDTLLDAADDLMNHNKEDVFSDTSEADIDAVTNGKIFACANDGEVNGDLCVGGIAGSMAVEHELDPEDDILTSNVPAYRRAYELKAILQDCVNRGTVQSRRNWAGGICGRISVGLAVGCEGYGWVYSEGGDYVGGIAGFSSGTVRDCWAKCTLSGVKYAGGIVGAAGLEGSTEGGVVQDCRAYVRVEECEQYAGAIAGVERGDFKGNLFVPGSLAGIGRVSLTGKAEPVSYASLLERKAPKSFQVLTLRFLADGQVLKQIPFRYGDSLDGGAFPAIPPKEGQFARWDRTDLTALSFDLDVSAVYTPYITALPSAQTRSDGRPILFAEGRFCEGDTVGVETLDRGFLPSGTPLTARRNLEQLGVVLPNDGVVVHTLRYLSPNGSPDGLEVYVSQGEGWQKLKTESVGSYLLFDLTGSEAAIAIVAQTSLWWIWLLALAGLATLLLLVFLLARRFKRRINKEKPAFDPKKKRRCILLAMWIVLGMIVTAWIYLSASGLLDGAAAVRLLQRYAKQDEFALELTVQADVGAQRLSGETELVHFRAEGQDVTAVRQFGASVYCSGGLVYLENGNSFTLDSAAFPDYGALLDSVNLLYQDGNISIFQNGSDAIYSVSASAENADALLRILFSEAGELASVDQLNADLSAKSGMLKELRFTASGSMRDGRPLSLTARLETRDEWETPDLPEPVHKALAAGETRGAGDLLPLLTAWGRLNLTDPLAARLSLSADCGPLVLNDDLEVFRTWANGKQVVCVQKAGRSLYLSEGSLYSEDGGSVAIGDAGDAAAQAELLGLAYRLCMRGTATCSEQDGGTLYSLRLGPDTLSETARTVLPAAEELDVDFTEGVMEVLVRNGAIETVQLSCGGTLHLLFTDAPASLSCELRVEDRSFALPEAVADAVLREK